MAYNNVVLWGAGNFSIKFIEKFRNKIDEILFFVDAKKYGQVIQGIKVISPDEFWQFYHGDCTQETAQAIEVIITVRSVAALQITASLLQNSFLGRIEFASSIYAQKYFKEHKSELNEVEGMLDTESLNTYKRLLDNMCNGRILDSSIHRERQYFPNSAIPSFLDGDVIVDAGVCNGEEVDAALNMNSNVSILAFEPNEESFAKLMKKYNDNKSVKLYPYALWNENTKLSGNGNSLLSTKYTEVDNIAGVVNAVKLDDIIKDKVDFIKMDIEGAELNALQGAKKTISKYRPNLAICIYHNIEDYIEIPLLIKSWNLDYMYAVKHHTSADTETVFYAIRRE